MLPGVAAMATPLESALSASNLIFKVSLRNSTHGLPFGGWPFRLAVWYPTWLTGVWMLQPGRVNLWWNSVARLIGSSSLCFSSGPVTEPHTAGGEGATDGGQSAAMGALTTTGGESAVGAEATRRQSHGRWIRGHCVRRDRGDRCFIMGLGRGLSPLIRRMGIRPNNDGQRLSKVRRARKPLRASNQMLLIRLTRDRGMLPGRECHRFGTMLALPAESNCHT